jgi:thioredoxin reductase (NADPH)
MLELIFLEGSRRGEAIRLNFDRAWFGRQSTCDFVLEGEHISRGHFFIERRGDDYVLVDNKSTNGTFVNRLRTTAVTLRAGYNIVAGTNEMQVREVAESERLPFRFVAERKGVESVQVIQQTSILLGRKSNCQLQLNEPSVSAIHAELAYHDGGVWVTDRSSGAGVYVNGQRVVSQQLSNGDLVTIKPFEITIALSDEKCDLGIRDCEEESPLAPENLPGNYQEAVAAPPRAEAGAAKPSASISALPHWMRAKAPIWVPTSDIQPNHFRSGIVVACLFGVLAWGGYALAAHRNTVYVPGPLTEKHSAIDCASCHASFASVPAAGCAGCHGDVHVAKNHAAAAHEKQKIGCAACHSEHRGASFAIARDVGGGCQAAGCHVTVHEKQKSILASAKPPAVAAKIPAAVAFEMRFQNYADKTDDKMHKKHLDVLNGECGSCHTNGDPSIKVEREDMRARCLLCHGFGPDATLRQRCYSCHFQHASDPGTILTNVRSGDLPAGTQNLALADFRGALVFLSAIAVIPVFYFAIAVGNWRVRYGQFRAKMEASVVAAPGRAAPGPALSGISVGSAIVVPKPSDNRTPGGNLRPLIDLDLCVACATCVHVCPFNVLEIVNEKAIAVRLEDCTGFSACAAECPTEAIKLVAGGAMQTVELPVYDANLETNVPGLYLAGEVTGKALIKIAINQGKKVVESIMLKRPPPGEHFDLIVVGAGPAGASTALAAVDAGLKVKCLEQGTTANTIRNFPRQKFVMAEPVMIPLYGPLWMEDTSKESLLERWQQIISATGLVISEEEKVLRVATCPEGFLVQSTKGEYKGARVVLAIGRRGSPRKLGVPGEDSTKVAYNLLDADAYKGKAICVVGGGDSGIEAANGMARQDLENRVWIVHRTEDFSRAKPRNQKKIQKSMDEGRVKVFFNAAVVEIRERSMLVKTATGVEEIENDFVFVMVGGESPKKFLSDIGIEFSQRAL